MKKIMFSLIPKNNFSLLLVLVMFVFVAGGQVQAAEYYYWPAYSPNIEYDYFDEYGTISQPTQICPDGVTGVAGTYIDDWWCFRWGNNANSLVSSDAWIPMMERFNEDFTYITDVMRWPRDSRALNGYYSTVYLYGSGLSTDSASNTDLGGWQSSAGGYPMVLASYYPVYSFDPACTYGDRVGQMGAMIHEGIHCILASMPGCFNSCWFHEGGNTWLQGTMEAQRTGSFDSMGFLSAGAAIAPFMPIECYSGWLLDGSFGGPCAEGNPGGGTCYWRNLLGGTQYGECFAHGMEVILGPKSVAWIWRNCSQSGRVLQDMAEVSGGIGATQMRRLIREYRARQAFCDFGPWANAYRQLLNNNWNITIEEEFSPYSENVDPWYATCYVATTQNGSTLSPEYRTLPGWSGANQIPLTVDSGATEASVTFNPIGANMSCQLVYRDTSGAVHYGPPVSSGTASIPLANVRNNVIVAVICNTDYIYYGDSTRTAKYDYTITMGAGINGKADINTKWYDNEGGTDTDPPTPNPATWSTVPYEIGSSTISMTATTGSDASGGIQYYFDETSGNSGGSDSGWQSSSSYTDTGLAPSTQYTYRVQMRDAYSNTGSYSSSQSATTQVGGGETNIALSASVDTSLVSSWETLGAVNDNYIPTSSSDNSGGAYGNWDGTDGAWHWVEYDFGATYQINSTSVYWWADGAGILQPTDAYIEYWNGSSWVNAGSIGLTLNQFNTIGTSFSTSMMRINMVSTVSTGILEWQVWGEDAGTDTDPPTPNPATWATSPYATSTSAIAMTATTGSDASGPVEYYFDETSGNSGGSDSGWQTSATYTDTGLSEATQYTYRLQMRDSIGNTGSYSSSQNATTQTAADTDPPTPNPATWATSPYATSTSAIAMTATTGSDASGTVEYYFDETSGNSGGSDSGWQTSSSYTDTGLSADTQYTYRVQMRDSVGNTGSYSSSQSATTQSGGGGLPAPWQNGDVGAVGATGSADYDSGIFTLDGSGADIWGSADGFHYVYQTLSGDGTITARVDSLTNTNAWAKSGVMIRETLTGGSKHAMMAVTYSNDLAFQRRTATDGSSTHTSASGSAPYWVRLTRSGDTLTAYSSANGSSWTQVDSDTISMATNVYMGLCVTSHSDGTLCTAALSNVSVETGGCEPTPLTPYIQVNGGSLEQISSVTVSVGDTVAFATQSVTGGSWDWTGPNGYSATTPEIEFVNAQTSHSGDYIATYTNDCGSDSYQTFSLTVSSGVATNIALTASVDTSHVSSWETLGAVNDGYVPTSSSDNSGGAYGNWDGTNGTWNWVEYDFGATYQINSTDVYWWADGAGILQPTDAYIEYWNGSSWVNAGSIGLALNQWNTLGTSFSTSMMRINMVSTVSTGILEWQVWGQ